MCKCEERDLCRFTMDEIDVVVIQPSDRPAHRLSDNYTSDDTQLEQTFTLWYLVQGPDYQNILRLVTSSIILLLHCYGIVIVSI